MDSKANFNVNAPKYIPKKERQANSGAKKLKYDNSGIEVVVESGQQNYAYDNSTYYNQPKNQGYKGHKKKNYQGGSQTSQNPQYYQGYQNYADNQPNYEATALGYSKYGYYEYDQAYQPGYSQYQEPEPKFTKQVEEPQILTQPKSTPQYYQKPQGKGQKGYQEKYNKGTDQGYSQSYNEPYYSKYPPQSQGPTKVVVKDISSKGQVFKEDLEDDLHDDIDTYAGESIPDQEGVDEELDDNYDPQNLKAPEEDYAGEAGEEDYDDIDTAEKEFEQMTFAPSTNVSKPSQGSQSTSTPQTSQPKSDKKYPLTFTNQVGFTDFVDNLLKDEHKNHQEIYDSQVNVLMIAEKPSIAKSISEALAGGQVNSRRMGKGGVLLTFTGYFGNVKAKFTVSSVMGHVYTSDFQAAHNKWDAIDYLDLYDVPIVKIDANRKSRITFTLQKFAYGKDILCLWLDCDKEGENICYEVIYNCYPFMNKKRYQQIYRAQFSSLTKSDLKAAFNKLEKPPNKYESLSVDCRQVIDLKIGVSFTRFLTSAVLPGIKADTNLLSYGPCQTPTLWFCVNQQRKIDNFISQEYFNPFIEVEINRMKYKVYKPGKIWDKNEVKKLMSKLKDTKTAKIVDVISKSNTKAAPAGLNTVNLLRVASSYLKMSPHNTMVVAEKLYTMGYITYPRTETTKYSSSFNMIGALSNFSTHPTFGRQISALLKDFQKPKLIGVDVGDHPPITPSKVGTSSDLKGDYWSLYEFICTHFFASLSPPAEYEEKTFRIDVNGDIFEENSMLITYEGFLQFMPWKRGNYVKDFPILKKDTILDIQGISYDSNWTAPEGNLTESDLIKQMEKNKIGTDASMPVHIENICQRGYVKVDAARRLIPTKLGKALIESLSEVDPEIVHPNVRAQMEGYVDAIAKGKKNYREVLEYAIELYKEKFLLIRTNYEKLLNSFKKYFDIDLSEMDKVYRNIRSKNEQLKIKSHVQKRISEVETDLNDCNQCQKGKMYIEYDQFDKYLLFCTNCNRRTKIVRDAVKMKVNKNLKCQGCGSYYTEVEVENPFLSGEKTYTGCIFCDDNLR